jgi:hypothetical protein
VTKYSLPKVVGLLFFPFQGGPFNSEIGIILCGGWVHSQALL